MKSKNFFLRKVWLVFVFSLACIFPVNAFFKSLRRQWRELEEEELRAGLGNKLG